MTARTEAMEQKYQEAKRSGDLKPLHEEEAVTDYKFWKLVRNRFPHDKLNDRHYMLVLKRESEVWTITDEELHELWREILPTLDKVFHYFKLNGVQLRSIANTPHIHVCDFKPEYV